MKHLFFIYRGLVARGPAGSAIKRIADEAILSDYFSFSRFIRKEHNFEKKCPWYRAKINRCIQRVALQEQKYHVIVSLCLRKGNLPVLKHFYIISQMGSFVSLIVRLLN